LKSLEEAMPATYKMLAAIRDRLEKHYRDMQDLEFTIQEGRLWMLQTRSGKRNGPAAVRMAVDMQKEKLISIDEAVGRVTPEQLEELLHPIVDPAAEKTAKILATGLPAGPGGATGQVVFTANDAVAWTREGKRVILVREETNPEDVEGMRAAQAILTARGGMTSHAALVARGWGKCCIVGAGSLEVEVHHKEFHVGSTVVREGDWLTLNGTRGAVYVGQLPMVAGSEENVFFTAFMKLCDQVRRLGVRANADTPADAKKALQFGAEGIGLFRTEHMFYGKGAEEPLFILRKMICSKTVEERKSALDDLFPFIKGDIKATLEAMSPRPVTIRLLDPPLHEFVPNNPDERARLAESLGIGLAELEARAEALHETNPMMGHRGVRLGVTYPEISQTWLRAIFEAAAELIQAGKKVLPEIMIPVLCDVKELSDQAALVKSVHQAAAKKYGLKSIPHLVGTMIEIPRAALLAGEIAESAEFFSYGTNDLTQMTYGFSRDDIGGFVPDYVKKGILPGDPFQVLDRSGVGELIAIGIKRGRAVRSNLKVGICGEHGGEPNSVHFCHEVGMNYVSCSPFRVPIARLAAAQAALEDKAKKPARKAAPKKAAKKPVRKAAKKVAQKVAKKRK
jgi:pyruvate,orthophosphate dikinase